ncbi:rna-binding cabeza [Pyrenophora seminiperda CCB06]|uniref:Rna-binding cabeza n=1 Tax=Pyrenophora seminiperda CCB06 TaxID=1302712 RepID=A0A3M7MFG9_9PLEO|nr:rna-binding cabeza [Pyrenophora seminiperda CCB06]
MAPFHNNKLNMISLFDEGPPSPKPTMSKLMNNGIAQGGIVSDNVSYTPTSDSDSVESDYGGRQPSKVSKTNKDGAPRKPRQPRPKLLKWSDEDWKNVVLGIIWACGETGVQIPFEQAAQIVGENCSGGALQQAVLKLRGKQNAEGFQIPSLRMAWARKNKNSAASSSSADASEQTLANTGVRKQTRMTGNQSLIVSLNVRDPRIQKELAARTPARLPSSTLKSSKVFAQLSGGSPTYTTPTHSSGVCDENDVVYTVKGSVQEHLGVCVPAASEYTNTFGAQETTPLLGRDWHVGNNEAADDTSLRTVIHRGLVEGSDSSTISSDIIWYDAVEHQPIDLMSGFFSDMPDAAFTYDPVYSNDHGVFSTSPGENSQHVPSQLDTGCFSGFASYDELTNDGAVQNSFDELFGDMHYGAGDYDASHLN